MTKKKSTTTKKTAKKATVRKTPAKKSSAAKKTKTTRSAAGKKVTKKKTTGKKAAAGKPRTPSPKAGLTPEQRFAETRQVAYRLSQQDGFRRDPRHYWLAAEARLANED